MQARISKARISTVLVAVAMLAGFAVTGVFSPTGASSATVFSSPTDLGTLGGTNSEAQAVSGNIVVGESQIAGGNDHAFAYDTADPSPHMIDLGTLGGTTSDAVAISGSVVVGWSFTAVDTNPDDASFGQSPAHAFAYDLDAADPHMIDIDDGDPNYDESLAVGISGRYIVGFREEGGLDLSGFVYDLDAPSPHMVDLGTLGGRRDMSVVGAFPIAIDGSIVVGYSPAPAGPDTPSGLHTFAEDLSAPSPHPLDLGTLGGQLSGAVAISGSVIGGWSWTSANDGDQHPMAYDLAAPSPHMIDLAPSAGEGDNNVDGVSGSVIVGDTPDGGFAYDLSDPSPHLVNLGAHVQPAGIRGSVVVGTGANGHAFGLDLSAASPHPIDLGTLGGATSYAAYVSATGLIAGYSDTGSAVHAAVWHTSVSTDVTPPTVMLNAPSNGAYYQRNTEQDADYSCADEAGGSGLNSCTGPVASGSAIPTSTLGTNTFAVTGVDAAENVATASATYHVVSADFGSGSVAAGGSFASAAVSPNTPLQTSVTSPVAGPWDFSQYPTGDDPPNGYSFLGMQSYIEAPATTAAAPLALHFALDSTLLADGGVTASTLQVFRDGVPIADCTNPSAVVAAPDPCVFNRSTNGDGSAEIDVYSSHASTWNFGKSLAAAPPVVISTASVPSGRVGVAYAKTLVASGGTHPIHWSIASGALPAGLTLNASTGVIAGTPTKGVTDVHFTVRATDASSPAQTVTKAFTMTIAPTADRTKGKVGVAYWTAIAPFKGTAPYTWLRLSGTLPPGLTLNPSTGALAGTPTNEGKYTFTVQVADAKKKKATTTITVTIAPAAINVTPSTLPSGKKDVKYAATIKATGGAPGYKLTVTAGKLPAGITLTSAGALSGKPTAKGTAHFTVTATDKYGFIGTRSYTVVIS